MSGFIDGENRFQSTLFPERVDDYVEEDSVVRGSRFSPLLIRTSLTLHKIERADTEIFPISSS